MPLDSGVPGDPQLAPTRAYGLPLLPKALAAGRVCDANALPGTPLRTKVECFLACGPELRVGAHARISVTALRKEARGDLRL